MPWHSIHEGSSHRTELGDPFLKRPHPVACDIKDRESILQNVCRMEKLRYNGMH